MKAMRLPKNMQEPVKRLIPYGLTQKEADLLVQAHLYASALEELNRDPRKRENYHAALGKLVAMAADLETDGYSV